MKAPSTTNHALWVYLGGSGLCLQMGWSHATQECWQYAFKEDVRRNNIPKIWSSKDGDKWRRFPLHQQALWVVPIEAWDTSQRRYSLPSLDKWSGRDIKQDNQEYFIEDSKWDGDSLEGQAPWCTLGIPNSIQHIHRDVTLSTCLWKSLSLTSRTRIRSSLGYQKMGHGLGCSWRQEEDATL